MATIFSKSGSFYGTASFYDPNIWDGGIVPTNDDSIFIRGIQKTVSQNYTYWAGTQSFFLLNNTTDLPPTGSLYTYTDRDQLVKLDYRGISASALLAVTVDKSASYPWGEDFYNGYVSRPFGGIGDASFPSKKGGSILNTSIIQYRPGTIVLSGSATASILRTNIEFGGVLELRDSSTYYINNYITASGGTFAMYDSSSAIWNLPWPSASDANTPESALNTNSYPLFSASFIGVVQSPFSQLILEGSEVRTNTTLSLNVSFGDAYLSVVSASKFEVGDMIFVGEEDIDSPREDNGIKSIYGDNLSSYDENFIVAGKDIGSVPNRLYIQRMNGLEGKVLATSSATELIVDEDRYQVGDTIVVNNQVRTITQIDDYDLLLKDYDFTDPSASLSEWEVDPTRGPSFQNWNIARGKGLTLQATEALNSFRSTYIKNLFLERVKIEAWVSNQTPISGGLSSPAFRDQQPYAVVAHADPLIDNDITTMVVGTVYGQPAYRSYMGINPNATSSFMASKNSVSNAYSAKPYIIGIKDIEDEHKLTYENYKGFSKGYIDDILIFEEINRGGSWGRVGINTTNYKFICTRFKVYNKCQKITLNSGVTVSINDKVFETGAEYTHNSGHKVIKLSSTITNTLDLKNKAFAFQGAEEYENNGVYPYIYSINQTQSIRVVADVAQTQYGLPLVDNYVPSINGYQLPTLSPSMSFTFDLTTTMSFNYFGFTDNFIQFGQDYTSSENGGLSLSGSNDLFNWTPITGGADFRRRYTQGHLRDWNLPVTHSFRYLRFQLSAVTNGNPNQQTYNLSNGCLKSFVIRSGSLNTFVVNNASDLNIGDHIGIYPTNPPGTLSANRSLKYSFLVQQSSSIDPPEDYFVITGKSGNTLTVDKNINFTVNKGSYVVKLNRNINIYGNYASGSLRTGRIGVYGVNNTTFQSFYRWKNVAIRHVIDGFPNFSGNTNTNQSTNYGSIGIQYNNSWIPWRLQGCSFYDIGLNGGFNWGISFSIGNNKGNIHIRGNIFHFNFNQGTGGLNSVNLPYIITSNFFTYSGNGAGIYNFSGLHINSYNVYIGINTPIGTYFPQNRNFSANGFEYMGGRQIVIRNYNNTVFNIATIQTTNDSTTTGNTGYYSDMYVDNVVKGNYLINGLSTIAQQPVVNYFTNIFSPVENMMLPARGGIDGNYHTTKNPYGLINFATNIPPGNLTSYYKNYNKWGYDVYTNNRGWIIKEPNNDWYKFYHFSSSLITGVGNLADTRNLFMSANVHIFDTSTASFTVGFDYYNDTSQIVQDRSALAFNLDNSFIYYDYTPVVDGLAPWTYTQSISFVPSSASYVGGLVLQIYKNGNLLENPLLLPKRAEPTHFEYTFNLSGSGLYQIGLAQDASPQGYLAMKNIWSRFNGPQTSSVMVKQNTFTMAMFGGADAQQYRNVNNQYPQVNPKFRLKGAKLF